MVDLQVNGYAGVDFLTSGGEAWTVAAHQMARDGVAAYVANLITSPYDVLARAVDVAGKVASADDRPRSGPRGAARCLGAHLEGPFLSPSRRGTHPVEHLRSPDASFLEPLVDSGSVVGVTIAPELPGALEVIAWLRSRDLLVSLGHSDATAQQAQAGFDAGARSVTHVFNGMSQPTSREAGLAGAALARAGVVVQLICDGQHLAPEIVALVVNAAGSRFVLVTDALSAAGAPDGSYRLGEIELTVANGAARNSNGGLAGSVGSLAEALRCAVGAGASVEQAIDAVTTRPAALLARADVGLLRPGDRADVVVLDDALRVTGAWLGGIDVLAGSA
jgi:N-acetylglucosamine-6-phosphate deacetylase